MANVKPEQVFVVATSNVVATGCAETHAVAFASPPTTGELYAFGDGTALINTAVAIPKTVTFGVGDPVRTIRLSDVIRKGQIERYQKNLFRAKTPLVWTIDFTNLAAAFNGSQGSSITLMIQYRKTSMDFCMQKIQITLYNQGSNALNADEMARLINESVTQQLMQNQWKPIAAYSDGADTVYVHETQMPADFSGINTPNQFIFDLSASSNYDQGTGIESDNWFTFEATNAGTITRGYYDLSAETYPDYLVYNQTGGYWALNTSLTTPFVVTTPTAIVGGDYPTNLTGDGIPILIKSHLRETDWGYAGIQNRTHYADTGYDTVNDLVLYDTHIIDYHENSMVEMGGSTSRRKAKRLIIYVPAFTIHPTTGVATAAVGDPSGDLEDFMATLEAANFF